MPKNILAMAIPQDTITIHQTGKILFGQEIVSRFLQGKRFLKIQTDDNDIIFSFHSHPRHDRHTIYAAPNGCRFAFIGRHLAKQLGTQTFNMAHLREKEKKIRSVSIVAQNKTAEE